MTASWQQTSRRVALLASQKPGLGERDMRIAIQDDMVENLDFDQGKGFAPLGRLESLLYGFDYSGCSKGPSYRSVP